MKQYRIDELRFEDYEKIKTYLDEKYEDSSVDGVYWIPLDHRLLDDVQAAHRQCQPFHFAVELTADSVSFELLIRTRKKVRCDCIRYANAEQRDSIIAFAEHLFEHLKLLS